MALAAETDATLLNETIDCTDQGLDLIHDLNRRLNAVWRYDQYIANAEWHASLKDFWCQMKEQEEQNIRRVKKLLSQERRTDSFWGFAADGDISPVSPARKVLMLLDDWC